MSDFAARLIENGMSADAADGKAHLFAQACERLGCSGRGTAAPFAVFVPGRIEVLGKHTDYAGGRSLLCAVERGICLVARPRADDVVRVHDIVSGTTASARLSNPAKAGSHSPLIESSRRGVDGDQQAGRSGFSRISQPAWALYLSTVVARLARNFPDARRGADIAFGGDLPMAAGMSSSSALVTALALAMAGVNNLQSNATWRANIVRREDLAEYLGTVENGQDFRGLVGDAGVGTFGGSEDHTAMLCCRAGELSQYSFCPVRHERQIPMPAGYTFVIAVSGVVAEKTVAARDAYNHASLATREIVNIWNRMTGRQDPTLRAAIDAGDDAEARMRALLPESGGLRERFDQFLEETFVIIPQVSGLIAAGRIEAIGDLVDRSQGAAESGLRNQVAETIFLARVARELGAVAASAFGAGFGGSVWALVAADAFEEFMNRWSGKYVSFFPQRAGDAKFFATPAGPAAIEMHLS